MVRSTYTPGWIPSISTAASGGPLSLREVLVGTIEEYARHLGHGDRIPRPEDHEVLQ